MAYINSSKDQSYLIPQKLTDLIPEDHVCFLVEQVVSNMNFARFDAKYAGAGHPAYHPRICIKLLMLAHVDGIRSSRRIAKNANENLVYIYLAEKTQPNFRTISKFRKNNKKLIIEVFRELNLFAHEEGLLDLSHLMIDGTKIKADAGNNRIIEKATIDKLTAYIEQVVDEGIKVDEEEDELYGNRGIHQLPENLNNSEKRRPVIRKMVEKINKAIDEGDSESVEQIKSDLLNLKQKMSEQNLKKFSFTDPESRFMQSHKKSTDLSYNAQIITDKTGLIVANDVSQQADDRNETLPLINQIEKDLGKLPSGTKFLGDAGYENGEVAAELEERGYDVYIPGKGVLNEPKKKFGKANFKYNEQENTYICPMGKKLPFKNKYLRKDNQLILTYRAKTKDCKNCPHLTECCPKNGKSRVITAVKHDKTLNRIKTKLKTTEGRAVYNLRKQTVERSFADIKRNKGFRNFMLRGINKVKVEFNLACIAHNLVMINNLLKKRSLNTC